MDGDPTKASLNSSYSTEAYVRLSDSEHSKEGEVAPPPCVYQHEPAITALAIERVQKQSCPIALAVTSLLFVVFAAVSGVSVYEFSITPSESYPSGWQVSSDNPDWSVCNIELYSDYSCDGEPLDLAGATYNGSSPVTSNFNQPGNDCLQNSSTTWKVNGGSGTDGGASISIRFQKSKPVNCIKVSSPKLELLSCRDVLFCSDCSMDTCSHCCDRTEKNYYATSPTVMQVFNDSGWVTTNNDVFDDGGGYSGLDVYGWNESGPPTNDADFVWLIVGIVLAALAFVALIIICALAFDSKGNNKTRQECRSQIAVAVVADDDQWLAFVQKQWGEQGREAKKLVFWHKLVAFPIVVLLGMAGFLARAVKNDIDISLELAAEAAEIVVPVAFVFTVCLYPLQAWRLRQNFARYRTHKWEAILGPTGVCFGTAVLRNVAMSRKVLQTQLIPFAEEGTLLVVSYKQKIRKKWLIKKLFLPVPEERMDTVKQFLVDHASFYCPQADEWANVKKNAAAAVHVAKAGSHIGKAIYHLVSHHV